MSPRIFDISENTYEGGFNINTIYNKIKQKTFLLEKCRYLFKILTVKMFVASFIPQIDFNSSAKRNEKALVDIFTWPKHRIYFNFKIS